MFRSVKNAWAVLRDNGTTGLYIQFEEPYQPHEHLPTKGVRAPFYEEYDGVVEYGMFDEKGALWTSAPGVFNAQYNKSIVAAVEVIFTDRHPMSPKTHFCAITKEFARHIMKTFNIPFEVIFMLVANEHEGIFTQKSIDIGAVVTHPREGKVKITRAIHDPGTGEPFIVVHTADGEHKKLKCSFTDLREAYKGITEREFSELWVHNVCEKHQDRAGK